MVNILFGWLTKPAVLITTLDKAIFVIEFIILIFVGYIAFVITDILVNKRRKK